MINFDEEIKKFRPSLEVDEAEDVIYGSDSPDLTDLYYKMLDEVDRNIRKVNERIDAEMRG